MNKLCFANSLIEKETNFIEKDHHSAMAKRLAFISSEFIEKYSAACGVDWYRAFTKLGIKEHHSTDDFEYYIIASSLFSSKIEGNSLDLNSFLNKRKERKTAAKKEYREIEDLIKAYKFASENKLTAANFLNAHKILSATLVSARERGRYRKNQVGVFDNNTGRPVYLAVEAEFIEEEIKKLFADINYLMDRKLSYKEVFYYASMIHLWVAMIHPFADGNGRVARLVEKWFLASNLGATAWSVNTEKYYWDHRPEYYKNISLGYNYYSLVWERCVPFLLMLPESLKSAT